MISTTRKMTGLAVIAAVAIAALLSGCAASAPGANASKAPTASEGKCVTAAQKVVAVSRTEPEPWFPAVSAVSMADIAGRSVWFIGASSTPIIQATGDAFKSAAGSAGLAPTVVYADGTTAGQTTLIQQAIAQKAVGIVTNGDPATFANVLKETESAKIAVTWYSQDVSVKLPDAITGSVPVDWHADGALDANWIMADSNCSAKVGILRLPTLTSSANETAGVVKTLAAECANCETFVQDIGFTTLSVDVPNAIRTVMTQHPDVKYWVTSYDALVSPTNAALIQVGVTEGVKLIGHDGTPGNFDLIRQGKQAVDLALPPSGYIGAYLVNNLATTLTGGKQRTESIPSRLIDATNAGEAGTDLFPSYDGSLASFAKAWGR